MDREYRVLIRMHPHYRSHWTIKPNAPESEGVDCSRYKWLVYYRAGVGMMERVPSADMAAGKGGWTGRDIEYHDVKKYDLLFFSWKDPKKPKAPPRRPDGHVATAWDDDAEGWETVTHASETRGIVVDRYKGKWREDFSKARRIVVGAARPNRW